MNRLATALLIALLVPAAATARSPAVPFMPGAVSGAANDYNLSVSDDGRTMVFARSEADFAKARIMVSERGRGPASRWSPPQPIAFSDERFRDSDPWLTPDGRTLYFVSDRPTRARPDKRDLDLWRSVKRRGQWQAPEHLGEDVNGRGEELGPEMHGDLLYFATAVKSGVGGLDIYAARLTRDGFTRRELAPGPFNTGASESDFTLSRDGATALFWRMVGPRGLIHLSRRGSDGRWSEPRPLPDSVNIGAFNFTPAFSAGGGRISFASDAPHPGQPAGLADIYEAVLE